MDYFTKFVTFLLFLFCLSPSSVKKKKMSDPQRWQLNQTPYTSSLPYSNLPAPPQQQRPDTTVYNSSLQQYPSPLPPLRPLQPNPFPNNGYPMYNYSRNSPNIMTKAEETEAEKADNRRTRISRAWYILFILVFVFTSLVLTPTKIHSDACRRKKIKCDTNGPGNTCKNCQSSLWVSRACKELLVWLLWPYGIHLYCCHRLAPVCLPGSGQCQCLSKLAVVHIAALVLLFLGKQADCDMLVTCIN